MEALPPYHEGRLRSINAFQKAFIAEALSWLNVPYRHRGRTKRGIDCLGLLLMIYKNIGFNIPDDTEYVFNWHLGNASKYEKGLEANCIAVARRDSLPGDICTFTVGCPTINHTGLWMNSNEFIHASIVCRNSVQISDIRHRYWRINYVRTYRPLFMVDKYRECADI